MFNGAVRNLDLKIPESGGKLPDFLAEIRWNLDWMLSMQDGDGGVWHKQTSENFCGFILPQDDHLISYVIGTGSAPYKSTCATADFAAVAAIAARCYGPSTTPMPRHCADAAKRAYAWAIKHPDVTFENPERHSHRGAMATATAATRCFGPLRNCGAPPAKSNIARHSRHGVAYLQYDNVTSREDAGLE